MRQLLIVCLCTLLFFLSCSSETETDESQEAEPAAAETSEPPATQTPAPAATQTPAPAEDIEEPDRVLVQHILIAFKGTIPGSTIKRSKLEAQQRAMEVFAMAQQGEDFEALVREYSDDPGSGKYRLCNFGITPVQNTLEFKRSMMVPSFGDVSFSLAPGEIGMATYDPKNSKYGWHIIKRLQ